MESRPVEARSAETAVAKREAASAESGVIRVGSGRARILLVDDHAILREGISALLALESDLEVIGS